MLRWTAELETEHADLDHLRRPLVEAVADFIVTMDKPDLNAHQVKHLTGALLAAMPPLFEAEAKLLATMGEAGSSHMERHEAIQRTFSDLCKKLVPKIQNTRQAQQSCVELFQHMMVGIIPHLRDEVLTYRIIARKGRREHA